MTSIRRSFWNCLKIVGRQLDAARRRDLALLLVLVTFSGAAEVVSIGAIVPFLALLGGLQSSQLPPSLAAIAAATGNASPAHLALAATVALSAAALVAMGMRLWSNWLTQKFVFGAAYDLGVKVYSKTLHQPYPYHAARNSSETLADINKTQVLTGSLLFPLTQAVGSAVIAAFIIAGLLYINWKVAVASAVGFAAIYAIVVRSSGAAMARNGVTIADMWAKRVQAVNEGLGGVRDVILDQTHPAFIGRFKLIESSLQRAQQVNQFLAAAPRFIVEGIGIILLAGIALVLTLGKGGLVGALPTLGAMAFGAQRLLPLVQNIYAGWAASKHGGGMLRDVVDVLTLPAPDPQTQASPWAEGPLKASIDVRRVSFTYPATSQPAVAGASLTIRAGEKVGLIGSSGSGKSTLMDLLLGLQLPGAGEILVDGIRLDHANIVAWRSKVAHVPQSIFLADASIAENIAFGLPESEIDRDRIKSAAKQAHVSDFADALPQGLSTVIGERGVRLSGGQRQRIGVARALYKRASLLVLDEATSALDSATESEVNAAIRALDRSLTIIVISHRVSSVAMCDRWFLLDGGSLKEVDRARVLKESGLRSQSEEA